MWWECYYRLVSKCDAGINSNRPTILVKRSAVHNLAAVLNELLTELFSKGIVLSECRIAGVDTVLHELVKVGVGTVEYIDTAGGDLAVDSGEFSVDDVVPHEQGVLSRPVPRGVESASFESIKSREDTVNIEIAVLATDGIQACLKIE